MVIMIMHHKKRGKRWRSRSRERVHPHAQVPKEPQTQPVVTPETDDVSDEDLSDMIPSSPATGPPPSAEQRRRSRRDERSRSRERTPPHSSSQDLDESSATVDPQKSRSERPFKVTTRTRRLTKTGSTTTKGKENCCWKGTEWPTERPGQKAEVYWFRWRWWRNLRKNLELLQTLNLLYQ